MNPKLKKAVFVTSVFILITVGIVSINYLDQKLISVHRYFLYCDLIAPEMSSNDALRILKSIRSSDYVYNENLQEVWGNFSDPLIRHLFGASSRLFFRNGQYMATSIAVDGSTWTTVKCQENR